MIYIFTTQFKVLVVAAFLLIETLVFGMGILILQERVTNLEHKPETVATKTVVVTPTGTPAPSLKAPATIPVASRGAVAK